MLENKRSAPDDDDGEQATLAGNPGRATSTMGAVVTRPTGARSLSGSYLTADGFTRRAIATGLSAPSTRV